MKPLAPKPQKTQAAGGNSGTDAEAHLVPILLRCGGPQGRQMLCLGELRRNPTPPRSNYGTLGKSTSHSGPADAYFPELNDIPVLRNR